MQQGQALSVSEAEEQRTISFKEMVELEHKMMVAFRQGDLIGYERYSKELSQYHAAIDGAVATEEAIAESGVTNSTFPDDAPQLVRDYVSDLSTKERMMLFAQVAIQDIIANAYQDINGHWRVRGRGEAGYVNVFEQPDFSYTKLVENMYVHLELQKMHLNKEQYEERLTVLEGLKEAAQGY